MPEEVMVVGGCMRVVNPDLDAEHSDRIPIEVDVKTHKSWDGE